MSRTKEVKGAKFRIPALYWDLPPDPSLLVPLSTLAYAERPKPYKVRLVVQVEGRPQGDQLFRTVTLDVCWERGERYFDMANDSQFDDWLVQIGDAVFRKTGEQLDEAPEPEGALPDDAPVDLTISKSDSYYTYEREQAAARAAQQPTTFR